ncbi:MAG: hypothetical protein ACE5SW_06585 [Nitrososphaeraceae archaeon]
MDNNEPSIIYPRTTNQMAISVPDLLGNKMVSRCTRFYLNKAAHRVCSR